MEVIEDNDGPIVYKRNRSKRLKNILFRVSCRRLIEVIEDYGVPVIAEKWTDLIESYMVPVKLWKLTDNIEDYEVSVTCGKVGRCMGI